MSGAADEEAFLMPAIPKGAIMAEVVATAGRVVWPDGHPEGMVVIQEGDVQDDPKTLRQRINERLGREFKPDQEPLAAYEFGAFIRSVMEWADEVDRERRLTP